MECKIPLNYHTQVSFSLTSCRLGASLLPDYFGHASTNDLNVLKSLTLDKLQLKTIGNRSFSKAVNLVKLDLIENHIESIAEAAFEGLVALEKIFLNYNRLSTIDFIIFKPCAALKTLGISDNNLVNLTSREKTILNVEVLNISDNQLTEIAEFNCLPHLTTLGLSRNRRLTLNASTFAENPAIDWLEIRTVGLNKDNGLKFLLNTPNLSALYLDDNNLIGWRVESLPQMNNLTTISMINCNLDTLDYSLLPQKLPRLDTVHIDENRFDGTLLQDMRTFLETNNIESSGSLQQRTHSFYNENAKSTMWLLGSTTFIVGVLMTIVVYWIWRKLFASSSPSWFEADVSPYASSKENHADHELDAEENRCSSGHYMKMKGKLKQTEV
jgi:Leucine-rich repeat (LRR) protein